MTSKHEYSKVWVIASYHQTLTNVYLFSDGKLLSMKREMAKRHRKAIETMPTEPIARNGSVKIYDLESDAALAARTRRPSLFGAFGDLGNNLYKKVF